MRHIFSVDNDNVKYIGAIANDDATMRIQANYPEEVYHEGCTSVLDYNEKDGVHYEYAARPTESAGVGYEWVLRKADGVWRYAKEARPLTVEERLQILEAKVE